MMWHCVVCVSIALEYADNIAIRFFASLLHCFIASLLHCFIPPTGTSMAWISKSCFGVGKSKKNCEESKLQAPRLNTLII